MAPHNTQGVIVLAGEDSNDCRIVAQILREHHPGLGAAKLVEIADPVRLKSASPPDLTARVRTLVGKAKGRALRARAELLGLVVHEDLDGYTDQQYVRVRQAVAAELSRQSPCDTAFALAAWESEAWLLLFPDAFPHVKSRWKVPEDLRNRDTGTLKDPKKVLREKLGPPVFRESDGPAIAEAARTEGLLSSPTGTNRSYADFITDLRRWAPMQATTPVRRRR